MEKRRIDILFGDDTFEAIMDAYLKQEFESQYIINSQASFLGPELEQLVRSQKFDLFVLVLNNIFWPAYPEFIRSRDSILDRLAMNVYFAGMLKEQYDTPIIALTGWGDPDHVEAAKKVSDFFFMLPPLLADFKEVFIKCIEGKL